MRSSELFFFMKKPTVPKWQCRINYYFKCAIHLRLDKRSHRRPTALRLPWSAEPSEPAGGCGESTALKEKSGRGGQEMSCASGKLGAVGEGGGSDGLAGEHTDVNVSPRSSGAATSCQRSHTRSCPFFFSAFASFKEPKIPTRWWWWTVFLSFHDGVWGCPVGFVILVVSERVAAFFVFLFPFPLVCKMIMSWWLSEHTPAVLFFCFF